MEIFVSATDALRTLQRVVRGSHPAGERTVRTHKIPASKRTTDHAHLAFYEDEAATVQAAKETLANELGYEHLDRLEDKLWAFAMDCSLDKSVDHVPAFVEANYREPEVNQCFMPVEYLVVRKRHQLGAVTLLPTEDDSIPTSLAGFPLAQRTGAIAVVSVEGTDYGAMHRRAREVANLELRMLRVALEGRVIALHPSQRRFRLGEAFAFSDELHGWKTSLDSAHEIELTDEAIALVVRQPLFDISEPPASDLEKYAGIALRWVERATLEAEPVVSLLFLFSALEALLGDKSEGLKGHSVAFRRAMLGHIADGRFSHPSSTYFLYDEVRSAAVHGEKVPPLDEDEVRQLARDTKNAINQYLQLGRDHKLLSRKQMREFLRTHQDAPKLFEWLRDNAGGEWNKYLDLLASKDAQLATTPRRQPLGLSPGQDLAAEKLS